MKTPREGAHLHQNSRHTACSFTGNDSPTGVPQAHLNECPFKGNDPGWLPTNIPFTIKVKIVSTIFFPYIYRYIHRSIYIYICIYIYIYICIYVYVYIYKHVLQPLSSKVLNAIGVYMYFSFSTKKQ